MDYKKHYNLLIEKAKNRILPEHTYKEKHHIIPKCMGGKKNKNIVPLTAREHYVAHWLLIKIYPNVYGLFFALNMMMYLKKEDRKLKISSKEYEKNKINLSSIMKNRIVSEYTKLKISKAGKGRKCLEETKLKISKTNKKIKHTKEWNRKVSKALKNKPKSNEHCKHISIGKTGTTLTYKHKLNIKKSYTKERIKQNRIQKTCRSVEIDGIKFHSIRGACRELNKPKSTIRNRLNSKTFPNYKYV